MADVHNKKIRSFNMSKIKARNTKPEIVVRKFLFSKGFRYKIHDKQLPGKPDLVFPKYKTLIFVHGCFWHGHKDCKYFKIPETRKEWWMNKIFKNCENDRKNKTLLEKLGWNVVEVWECDLKPKKQLATLLKLPSRIMKTEGL
jgi:DNA mismatch endonuclease (patch repair protein)